MHKVEISPRTIIFTVAFLLFLYVMWIIHDLLYSLFIGFILMSALRPIVIAIKRRGIPHTLSVLIAYISFLLFFIFLFSIVVPNIIAETVNLVSSLPIIITNVYPEASQWLQIDSLLQYLPDVTTSIVSLAGSIFTNFIFVVTTLFFGFYLLQDDTIIERFFRRLFNEKRAVELTTTIQKAEKRMSGWFWGELLLMTVVGWLTYIGLVLIGIRNAVPLAVLAGLLEVVPNVGPIMSSIPAFIIGLSVSPITGVSALALFFIVQQLENNLIVPMIMKRAVGINPIVSLVVLIAGGRLGGVIGILVAIPMFVFFETIIRDLVKDDWLADILR